MHVEATGEAALRPRSKKCQTGQGPHQGRNQFSLPGVLEEDKVLTNDADISEKYDIELLFSIVISSAVQN